jgi:N6-L-threonylcarbamoyladenine synthase
MNHTLNPLILAIDTSCDDTAAAVTQGWQIWSNVIASQTQLHKPYGGVFPTVARQAHRENIDRVIRVALKRAGVTIDQIEVVAVTQGPGLAPALEVGIAKAKELALTHDKLLIPVNHLEGHLLSALVRPKSRTKKEEVVHHPKFPTLGLIVSGGHTLFVLVRDFGQYEVIGTTIDDAAGECLDKIGRMLNLGYPAGPNIEHFAKLGNERVYDFPLPMTHSQNYNLSFSGLKTFARNLLEAKGGADQLSKQELYDMCASVQYAVFRHIIHKLNKVLLDFNVKQDTTSQNRPIAEVWLGGGVAANTKLRQTIRQSLQHHNKKIILYKTTELDPKPQAIPLRVPYAKRLCMDNAAMIGVAAGTKFNAKTQSVTKIELDRKNKSAIEKNNPSKHDFIDLQSIERMPRMKLIGSATQFPKSSKSDTPRSRT